MTGTILGQYQITDQLGAGGMGEVWRATDTTLGREVALKLLPADFAADPDRRARFEREAKVLASLNHPNIATLYGLETVESGTGTGAGGEGDPTSNIQHPTSVGGPVHFLVMELVDGEDLSDRIARGPVPVEESASIALGIAEALESAHAAGIVHRDLKPANVKIRPDGSVKVLDFGLAKAWETDAADHSLSMSPTVSKHATLEGVILGTAAYMSPEQAAGTPADQRADVWAFGVVLWEMLTGHKLFEGETVSHVLASVLKDEPDIEALPDDTPPVLVELVSRCLRKKPRQRLQAIGDARVHLEEYLADPDGFDASAAAQEPAAQMAPGWRPWLPWAALAVLAAGLVASLLLGRSAPERILRATIPPPEGSLFNLAPVGPGPVAVSPDGTRLAFSAQAEDGSVLLFVRRLDAPDAVVLSGTDGAQYPFWSPDSRWIGFFTRRDGTLKKIDTLGGPPVTLCDAPNGKGGSWGADGIIVFAPDATTPIHRVAAAGGESTPITEIDSSRHDSHRHPRFLPDGTNLLFLARGQTDAQSAVVVTSVDGGEARDLLQSPSQAEATDNHLLFVRDNTLMSQPFDSSDVELVGEAVPVAEAVMEIPGAAVAVFSASPAGILAYQSGEAESATALEWRDRDGVANGVLGDLAPYGGAVISPDGRHAAVRIPDPSTGAEDLWIYDIERNIRTRFTFDADDDTWPVWTPDSSRLFFASNRDGRYAIFAKDISGAGEVVPVYAAERDIFPTDLSPDGRHLVFFATGGDTTTDLFVLPLGDGGEAISFRQTEFSEGVGKVSPDGRWLSYNSDESGQFEVYVTTFPEPGRRWQVSTDSGGYAYWRADGREIVYTAMDGSLMAAEVDSTSETFRVGRVEELFDIQPPEAGGAYYHLTSDGQRFLVVPSTIQRADTLLNLIVNWEQTIAERQ
jgi:Tol biopolymer transport system component